MPSPALSKRFLYFSSGLMGTERSVLCFFIGFTYQRDAWDVEYGPESLVNPANSFRSGSKYLIFVVHTDFISIVFGQCKMKTA